jgi:hypothetical protein
LAEWQTRVCIEDLDREQREVFMASRAAADHENWLVESAKRDMDLLALADECAQAVFENPSACFIVFPAGPKGYKASLHFAEDNPDLSPEENAAPVVTAHGPTWAEAIRGALLQALKI